MNTAADMFAITRHNEKMDNDAARVATFCGRERMVAHGITFPLYEDHLQPLQSSDTVYASGQSAR